MTRKIFLLGVATIVIMLVATACLSDSEAEPDGEPPVDIQPSSDPILVVESEQLVTDILGVDRALLVMLSPDGSSMVYLNQTGSGVSSLELCLYTFSDAVTKCFSMPEGFLSVPYHFYWSPDSTKIAFTENPKSLGHESDIWVFDTVTGEYENRSDDDATGAWRGLNADEFMLDYLPMWNKTDGDLYFFRSAPTMNLEFTLELYRFSEDDEPEKVADFTEAFSLQLPYFNEDFFYMDGVASISPDGGRIAFMMSSFENVPDVPENGLWVADLSDGGESLIQLADTPAFSSALPAWQEAPANPVGLAWTADSAGVVVIAKSSSVTLSITPVYYFNAQKGVMSPLVDFSGYPSVEAYLNEPGTTGLSAAYFSPFTTAIGPEKPRIMFYNNFGGISGFFVDDLPPDDMPPQFTYKTTLPGVVTVTRTSTSTDGKLLIAGLMLTVTEP